MDGALVSVTLSDIATAAVREGCVGETLAAVSAGERLERSTDPEVRAALAKIAEDETQHAELAWRTVAWAIEQGGDAVARAVQAAFRSILASYDRLDGAVESEVEVLEAHGWLSRLSAARLESEVMLEIIAPMAAAVARSVGGMGGRRRAIARTSSPTLRA